MCKLIAKHNADHPYERHVLTLVEECLAEAKYPTDRIEVRVEFTPVITTWSKHKLDLEMLGATPSGSVTIFYNSLFLMQDPVSFFDQVVAHEVAHILNGTVAYRNGTNLSDHGVEWSEWLERISETALPQASIVDSEFDHRAVVIKKGGVLAICDCENSDNFQAHRNSGEKVVQLRSGEIECNQCGAAYRIAGSDELPASIVADLQFIAEDIKERLT